MADNIKIIEDDLLTTKCNVIVHCCNNKGVMGSGVAKQIKDKYPTVYNAYRTNYEKHGLTLGQVISVIVNDKQYICNLIGQDGYGYDGKQYINYESFKMGLYTIRDFMLRNGFKTIAFPYNIGCYRAGGKWEVVYEMIEDVFSDIVALAHNLQVEIYKLDMN